MKQLVASILLMLVAMSAWSVEEATNVKAMRLMNEGNYREAADMWSKYNSEIRQRLLNGPYNQQLVYARLMAIANEANCRYMLDDYITLEILLEDYVDIWDDFSDDLDNLAKIHYYKLFGSLYYGRTGSQSGAYVLSERYYEAAVKFAEELEYPDEELMSTLNRELAQLYYKWGVDISDKSILNRALECLDKTIHESQTDADRAMILARIAYLSVDEDEIARLFDESLSLIDKVIDKTPKSERQSVGYAESLRRKGKILSLQRIVTGKDTYKKARKLYEQYIAIMHEKAEERIAIDDAQARRQAWIALTPFIYDCFRLGERGADLSYDMSLYIKDYLVKPVGFTPVKWRQVAAKLRPEEAAIEFAMYDDRLMALVIKRDSKLPQMVDLGNVSSILDIYVNDYYTAGEVMTSYEYDAINDLYASEKVRDRVWTKELLDAIGDSRRVYFAADGFIHQYAIEYIVPDETFTAVRLSSTAKLLDRDTRGDLSGNALLVGGATFYSSPYDSDVIVIDNDTEALRHLRNLYMSEINELEGTEKEVVTIAHQRGREDDTLLINEEANENNVRRQSPSHSIVHIATHGFYYGSRNNGTDLKPQISDDYLSRCYLMLAGAGRAIDETDSYILSYDGVLSGEEIANSDWSGVKLLVLSACQSGIGNITTDGVYGMQRAVKMSGAKGMLVSLWNVNDYATSLLMEFFYEELSADASSARDALQRARKRLADTTRIAMPVFNAATLSHDTPKLIHYDKPQYTFPFLLIDVF